METAVLVIILIILLAVVLAICFNWSKLICECLKHQATQTIERAATTEKDYQINDQSSLQPFQKDPSRQGDVVFEFSQDPVEPGTQFVKFNLQNLVYQTMKICANEVIFESKEKGNETKKFFTTRQDIQFNEYYQSHEENKMNPKFRVFEGKTNKIKYQGNDHKQKLMILSNNFKKKYNQILPSTQTEQLSIEVINAFALFLNLEEQDIYFKSNTQQQQQKRKWFIPSDQQLRSFFWQFEPLGYDVERFSKAIYIIQEDTDQNIFFAEVKFKNALKIHTTNAQSLEYYQPLLQELNQFFNNILEHSIICFKCKEREASGLNICLNMLKHSNSPLKTTIKNTRQMQDFIDKQFYSQS